MWCLRVIALFTLVYLPVALFAESIDTQIEELKKQRRQCQLQANLAKRTSDRLMTQDFLAYRRELQKEEMMEERIQQIDKEIQELELKKAKSSQ
jgi:hypothetical protein